MTAPIAVIIPTYNRGDAVLRTLDRVYACDPGPAEVWVHIDGGDGALQARLIERFPELRIVSSPTRIGPGGGRGRCLTLCTMPYAVSFDDDSFPVDADFFAVVARLMRENPRVAILNANIWHRHQPERQRTPRLTRVASFTGCGFAIRVTAYRGSRGYLPRPVAYAMEETDIALQLFAAGWHIAEAQDLRVFHDTELQHHESPEVIAGTAANIGLFVFLNYPVLLWPWGLVQLGNFIFYCLRVGRFRGLGAGLQQIPGECLRHRALRRPFPVATVLRFLWLRRRETSQRANPDAA